MNPAARPVIRVPDTEQITTRGEGGKQDTARGRHVALSPAVAEGARHLEAADHAPVLDPALRSLVCPGHGDSHPRGDQQGTSGAPAKRQPHQSAAISIIGGASAQSPTNDVVGPIARGTQRLNHSTHGPL